MNLLPDFRFLRPTSLDDAVAALAEAPGCRPLAGGTDLLPNLRRGLGEPGALVDLGAVPGMDLIAVEGEQLVLGATARLEDVAASEQVRGRWPVLAEAAATVAGPTHRAAATVGGNLCQDTRCIFYNQSEWWRESNDWCLKHKGAVCHVVPKSDRCYAVYAGDLAPALMVLRAEVEIVGAGGSRRLPIAGLYHEEGRGYLTLAPGEILARVLVPAPAQGTRAGYAKNRVRDAVDFPLAGVAVALRREGDALAGLDVALTGVASAPLMVPGLEGLLGSPWNDQAAKAVGEAVRKGCNAVKSTLAPPKYRRRVASASAVRLAARLWEAYS
ncbi:MAG: 4-hydroxybenzoyl-CoA reductase subunit beta [Rhodospirillales bacterium]|nr:4-hydroxybenzoyl-CoA reductase subunit beta [Rhodospirillales bacterium]